MRTELDTRQGDVDPHDKRASHARRGNHNTNKKKKGPSRRGSLAREARSGGVADAHFELAPWDTLCEEVGGHLRVGHVAQGDLAVGDPLLECQVATQKVLRACRTANTRADAQVGEVGGAEQRGPVRGHTERALHLARVKRPEARLLGFDTTAPPQETTRRPQRGHHRQGLRSERQPLVGQRTMGSGPAGLNAATNDKDCDPSGAPLVDQRTTGLGPGLVAHVLWRYCMRLASSGVGGVRRVRLAFGRHPMHPPQT